MLLPNGKIIAAGDIGSYDSQSVWGIARLNGNGSLDTTFATGFTTNYIKDFVLQPDGKIITGGYRTYFVDHYLSNFVRFNPDGSTDTSFDAGTGFDSSAINCLSLFNNGNILVGGDFETYNGFDSSKLILFRGGDAALSNNTVELEKLALYPNPAKDIIHLSLPEGIGNFTSTITDISGKTVYDTKSSNDFINVQSLAQGIYILKIKSEQKEFHSRFIKE